ncbi:pyrokinin-1 receptor-like [Venturia canescens]|uniref:pyrokinin-1 receptor-like n=1 Tax=Venturia canescens TaxID=32260 RepID=UPI001C9CEC41|nr:pyrokinin-1 receptor-like [Venturia canescens]
METFLSVSNASSEKASSWSDIDYASSNLSSNYIDPNESSAFYEDSAYIHLGSRRDALYVVLPITIIYLSIFITGTIGNVSTCIVIARNKSMHTATNYYLFSLAVSDLLLLISGLPVEVYLVWSKYPYIFGEHFCRLRGLAAECSTNASVLTITAFTVERYVAICHPFLSHTMSKLSRAIRLILVVWVVALSFATPLALQFGIVDRRDLNPDYVMCALKVTLIKHSFEISTFLFFVVPMILITVLYVMIGLKLRKSNMMKRDDGQNRTFARASSSTSVAAANPSRKDERNCRHHTGRSSRRVIKMLVAVVVAFFLCWAPFHVQRLIAIYGTDDDLITSKNKWVEFLYLLFTYVSGVLYYVSATINPILYNIMSNKFREAFMETLARTCGRGDFSVSQEQRSYSSFSRSQQQQRGAAGVFGSRNVTGGSALPQESSDYSGTSIREESGLRRSASGVGESRRVLEHTNSTLEGGRQRSSKETEEEPPGRGSSRKFGSNAEPRNRDDSSSHLMVGTFNPDSSNRARQETSFREASERSRRWRGNSSRSRNNVVGARNDRNNSKTNKRSGDHRRLNYEPVTIDTNVVRRKKWWRLFKWLPSAKAFGFGNERARYTSPSHSIVNDIECNREAYSMTACYTSNADGERPV